MLFHSRLRSAIIFVMALFAVVTSATPESSTSNKYDNPVPNHGAVVGSNPIADHGRRGLRNPAIDAAKAKTKSIPNHGTLISAIPNQGTTKDAVPGFIPVRNLRGANPNGETSLRK
jgi:hypothetical protein